jgi:hypothetical protein
MNTTAEEQIVRLVAIIEALAARVAELEFALHGPQMSAQLVPVTVH